eukprot:TRINITY_DN16722_c0_g1_i1.p1 TRINITY_DN16722_c0_g1~~TRINITY_DN16722_c0_g1_i1.p1  ORF type:complete len:373 (-),score=61.66 TRINITY_DN16722_c0_g1_i1:411-1529(-)
MMAIAVDGGAGGETAAVATGPVASRPQVGDALEVEWPCEAVGGDSGSPRCLFWLPVYVMDVQSRKRRSKNSGSSSCDGCSSRYLLRFDDGGEAWNSLRLLRWRHRRSSAQGQDVDKCMSTKMIATERPVMSPSEEVDADDEADKETQEKRSEGADAKGTDGEQGEGEKHDSVEVVDPTGFVHEFDLDDESLLFCDELHERREELGDKSRGDSAYGEPLRGNLVSVVIRREALDVRAREVYLRLHHRCGEEVKRAWPDWIRRAGGPTARVRPSQDLRLLQYCRGAAFKEHVDSGWACQALVYLNEDFRGGMTIFPNLGACYQPRRGRVLLWRSVCVGHKPSVPGSQADHPALHVAGPVHGGIKRVVSINLVLA